MTHQSTALAALLCVSALAASARAEMVVQACFSPQSKCSKHILREIDNARKEILVAVYAFTSDELASALAQARHRGVTVQVILDRDFDAANDNSKGKTLEIQNIPVRRASGIRAAKPDRESGLMHQKFAVIDRRLVFSGSYNWTNSADKLNHENLLLFRDAASLAEEYRRVFIQLWEQKP
jgi:phosphatidylserine/phosphatidylglycerophosphate/cardiolipin synthase-like enzyme